MGRKLYNTGYRKLEGNEDTPSGYTEQRNDSEVYPVFIYGETKPIPDNKIGLYLTTEFFYYNRIYENIVNFGLPCDNWTDAPLWVTDLFYLFNDADKEFQNKIK